MRNLWRLLAFDLAAPLAAATALVAIGVVLVWPWWWISACSVLLLLIVQGVLVNFWLLRRDSVTLGTDDEGPRLRLAVVALCATALTAAVAVGYTHWTEPDRDFTRDSARVLQLATEMAEAAATFTPREPHAAADKAAALMVPERAEEFRNEVAKSSAELAKHNVSAQAVTLSAGVEAIGPEVASVPVVLRVIQSAPGKAPDSAVAAVRVALTKRDGGWLVLDVLPIHQR